MAKMGLIYKINPVEPGKEVLNKILEEVKTIASELGGELKDHKIDPLAFGLYSLTILLSVDEADESFPDKFESKVASLSMISSIENVGMTRL